MDNSSDMVSLKRLIDIGKDKGYITYEELNDDLPDDVVSSEYIDDLMMMFEELDIMVIDEASKEEIEKSKKAKKKQQKALEKENYRAEISEAATRVSDPVKMYLKEMGCISLLTREGEVEIAKRIEAGEKEALKALLKCCVGIEYIIGLGDRLRKSEIKLKDVINDLEEEEAHTQIGERKESIITLIDKIKDLYDELCVCKQETLKKGCSPARKKKLRAKIDKNHKRMVELIGSFKLEKTQLDLMVERLSEIVAEIDEAEKDISDCMFYAGGKPISYLKKCIGQMPKSAKDDQVVTPLRLKKCDLVALKDKVDNAQTCIKKRRRWKS
jgi:RNA polymerase primary sigma factor